VGWTGKATRKAWGEAGRFARTVEEAFLFSAATLGVRGLSLRFICCETRNSLLKLEVILAGKMTLLHCCFIFSSFEI
jgi:hypothetical protein